jgi:integrase
MPCQKGKTRYSIEGKVKIPLSQKEFEVGVRSGKFLKDSHKAFAILLYYTGLRKNELRRAIKQQFKVQSKILVFDVGQRLKHSKQTPALKLPLKLPFMEIVLNEIELTKSDGAKVFDFSDRTAYNIIRRVWHYPHHLRLTRITKEFNKKRTISQVQNFTGLTLQALNSYIGEVDISLIGEGLAED